MTNAKGATTWRKSYCQLVFFTKLNNFGKTIINSHRITMCTSYTFLTWQATWISFIQTDPIPHPGSPGVLVSVCLINYELTPPYSIDAIYSFKAYTINKFHARLSIRINDKCMNLIRYRYYKLVAWQMHGAILAAVSPSSDQLNIKCNSSKQCLKHVNIWVSSASCSHKRSQLKIS